MKTIKEKAINEIESVLWKLGCGTNSIFPDFEIVNCDLDYGVQKDGDDILLETKYKTKNENRILVRVSIGVEEC